MVMGTLLSIDDDDVLNYARASIDETQRHSLPRLSTSASHGGHVSGAVDIRDAIQETGGARVVYMKTLHRPLQIFLASSIDYYNGICYFNNPTDQVLSHRNRSALRFILN